MGDLCHYYLIIRQYLNFETIKATKLLNLYLLNLPALIFRKYYQIKPQFRKQLRPKQMHIFVSAKPAKP